jgi:hypothetical protein
LYHEVLFLQKFGAKSAQISHYLSRKSLADFVIFTLQAAVGCIMQQSCRKSADEILLLRRLAAFASRKRVICGKPFFAAE